MGTPPRTTIHLLLDPPGGDGGWREEAACRDADVELFFSQSESDQREALAYCAECPVRERCLMTAVLVGEEYGIWGGTLEGERRGLAREARRSRRMRRWFATR